MRIISGNLKGNKIKLMDYPKIRPTINRMRETLFNWLNPIIENSLCLDCFSGSGILAFESISRKAKKVTILEKNKNIKNTIFKNAIKLNILNKLEIIHVNSFYWLKNNNNLYDIVFIDPPFFMNIINKIIFILEKKNILSNNSLIYIEMERNKMPKVPKNWFLHKKKITKKAMYLLYINKIQ